MKRWTLAFALLGLFAAGCDDKDASPPSSAPAPSSPASRVRGAASLGPAASSLSSWASASRGSSPAASAGDGGRAMFDGQLSGYSEPAGGVYAGGGGSYAPRSPIRYTSMSSVVPKDLDLSGPPSPVDASKYGRLRGVLAQWGGDVKVADEMLRQSVRKGMNPLLVLATGMQESGLRNGLKSSAGALGAMQVMPGTACEMGACNQQSVRYDVAVNVNLGTNYMKEMWNQFVGSDMLAVNPLNPGQAPRVAAALAAYNAGPGAVEKAGGRVPRIAETQGYVQKIFGYYSQLNRAMAD